MRVGNRRPYLGSKRGFIELVSTTFVLTVLLALLMVVVYFVTFLSDDLGLQAAANEAAEITGDPNIEAKDSPGEYPVSYLAQFQAQSGNRSYIMNAEPSRPCEVSQILQTLRGLSSATCRQPAEMTSKG